MATLSALRAQLQGMGKVLLGYSGGVDSALLAVVGTKALGRDQFLAVIGRSGSYPLAQYEVAMEVARRFRVPLATVKTGELDDPRYAANPVNRCFFCKAELWSRLRPEADKRGFDTVIDGTNADDLHEHRPGFSAGSAFGVRSPLAELGWTKADVREAARGLGLSVWDAPASPCLASRIRHGVAVTPARLGQVEAGEAFLRGMGIRGDVRVRHHDRLARLEVEHEWFSLLDDRWPEVRAFFLSLGFDHVERDPAGYRRGSLLALAASA
jgi:uncharacterized protein